MLKLSTRAFATTREGGFLRPIQHFEWLLLMASMITNLRAILIANGTLHLLSMCYISLK